MTTTCSAPRPPLFPASVRPGLRTALLASLVAAGCGTSGGEDDDTTADDDAATDDDTTADDDTTPSYEADPRVDTYLPDGYRPEQPVRIVFLGDSITEGSGASANSLEYTHLLVENDADEWQGWDEEDLQSLFPSVVDVIDVSRGGALTSDVINSQLPELEGELTYPAAGETLVVMTAGGNDAQLALVMPGQLESIIAEVTTNFHAIAQYFADPARFPDGVYLYAANVYEPSDGIGQTDSCFFGMDYAAMLGGLDDANAAMRAVAEEEGVALVDLRGHFLGHGFYHDDEGNPNYDAEDPSRWFYSDCIHPNDRGHHEVRRLFYTALDGRAFPAGVDTL